MEPHSGAGFSARRTISFTLLLILLATPVMGMDLHYFPSNQDAKRRATGFVDSSNFTANEVCWTYKRYPHPQTACAAKKVTCTECSHRGEHADDIFPLCPHRFPLPCQKISNCTYAVATPSRCTSFVPTFTFGHFLVAIPVGAKIDQLKGNFLSREQFLAKHLTVKVQKFVALCDMRMQMDIRHQKWPPKFKINNTDSEGMTAT